MDKVLFFLIISLVIVGFSVITLSSAPFINNKEIKGYAYENCQYYADQEELSSELNERYKIRRKKTLCERRKAMHGLEYGSFIFDIIFGFFCALLSFLQYLKIGKNFQKNTGLIGLITGIIGFILTFIYFIYSSYIFTNDVYYKQEKLFPNGAKYKVIKDSNNANVARELMTAYKGETDYNSTFVKFKDLGKKQYNYDSDNYKIYYHGNAKCNFVENYNLADYNSCDYVFGSPKLSFENKYLYDKWTTTLIFAFLISICDLGLSLFGLLIFKEGDKTE